MGLRLLLDEHVEHGVRRRLETRGHDVVHVDTHPTLSKGDSDESLAAFTRVEDRILVTYDDDFVSMSPSAYRCVFLFEDESLPANIVADVVHNVARMYPQDELAGLQKVGREWL